MASEVSNGGLYTIMNISSRTVMDMVGGSRTNNMPVLGQDPRFWKKDQSQIWRFEMHDKYWKVINLKSGTALTLRNGNTDNGTLIVGSDITESDRQLWDLKRLGDSNEVAEYGSVPSYFKHRPYHFQ